VVFTLFFQKVNWVFKNGQKKCPKLKNRNTFWKKWLFKNGKKVFEKKISSQIILTKNENESIFVTTSKKMCFSKKYFDFSKMDKKNVQNRKPNLLFGKKVLKSPCDEYALIFVFRVKKL
jgi:hypothetical protein